MEPIKLVTIGLPNLLEGLVVNAFQKRGSLKIIGNYQDLSQYLSRIDDEEPSLILIESAQSNDYSDVLYSHPRVRLVSIENSGRKFHLWKLVPHLQTLGEASPDELVSEILSEQTIGSVREHDTR